jgi:hypothetical protein
MSPLIEFSVGVTLFSFNIICVLIIQVALRMDGNVIINSSETAGELSLEQAAITTIKTEELPAVSQVLQQPDTKPPSEDSHQVSV